MEAIFIYDFVIYYLVLEALQELQTFRWVFKPVIKWKWAEKAWHFLVADFECVIFSKLISSQETAIGEGAKVSEQGIIETFDSDEEALDAFDNGIVVCTYINLISKYSILSIDTCFIGWV